MRAGKICMFQLRLSLTAADQDALIQVKVTKEYVMVLEIFLHWIRLHRNKGQLGLTSTVSPLPLFLLPLQMKPTSAGIVPG